jgi:branched-chain amino acid transport system ATP-binding protein
VAQEYAVEAHGLTKDFRGFRAVDNVNLRVTRGSIHALIGPNGAGKTTVFNLLSKFIAPDGGRILHDGRDITRFAPEAVARRGLVRSFQISAVFPELTVLENVRVALQRETGTSFHFWRSLRSLRSLDGGAQKLIDAVGLAGQEAVPAGELPYGSKRALEIATTLALEPAVMLLDEPTAGMAQAEIGRITELIRRSAAGRTVLLVEHNLSVVADLCDTITVLQRGSVLAEGDYDSISSDPAVIEAYMGTGHA